MRPHDTSYFINLLAFIFHSPFCGPSLHGGGHTRHCSPVGRADNDKCRVQVAGSSPANAPYRLSRYHFLSTAYPPAVYDGYTSDCVSYPTIRGGRPHLPSGTKSGAALPWASGIASRLKVCQNIEAAGAPPCVYRGVPKGCAYSSMRIGESRKKTHGDPISRLG